MLTIPKIYKDLPLGNYAREMADQSLKVWVNVPRAKLEALQGAISGGDLAEIYTWLAEVWQDVSRDDVVKFATDCAQTDPQLLTWLTMQTMVLITEHRAGTAKN